MRSRALALLLAGLLAGCAGQATTIPGSPSATPGASAFTGGTPRSTVAASATPEPSPPDLSARPLVWFAPLPPLPTNAGRPYIGSEDFMSLFTPGADWQLAASRVGVFKLYGEWVADASDQDLRAVVTDIGRRGMVLAVEMGPLDATPDCGGGVESFGGLNAAVWIGQRLRGAGGTLAVIALDEPYYFAHVYDGPGACHWPVATVAAAVAHFIATMRNLYPALIVGDIEPTPTPVTADDLASWLDAYAAAVGEPPAFLHLDIDWARSGWPALGMAVQAAGSARGVPVGMIYNGGSSTSDAQWLSLAGRRVLTYEADAGAQPDHVIFQSWMDKPDHVLPESDPLSFAALVNRYFDDRAGLGEVAGGPVNLALRKPATASSSISGSTPDRAVDGDSDTLWSAGTGPPGWIQIDLGGVQQVAEIRLQVSQYPTGPTHHTVSCLPAAGAQPTRTFTLDGTTADLDVLTVTPDASLSCRIIRVATSASPSWVAWREIEVLGPQA